MARYREPDSAQNRMVVLNFEDLFPEEHPIARLLSVIRSLDLSEFHAGYGNGTARGGRPAVPPDRVLSIIIYSLLYGNLSMRNLERDLSQRADLMYLSGGLKIDHSTFGNFRVRHAEAIKSLFSQTVFLGVEAGIIDLDTICIDATRIRASANRRDIGTREELEKRYAHIQAVCAERYQEWESKQDGDERELLKRRLERAERHKKRLAAGLEFLERRRDLKRVHLSDRDADLQRDGANGFIVGYAAHNAVDAASRMIVHQEVVTTQADSNRTVSMVEGAEKQKRAVLPDSDTETKYVLDCGYAGEKILEKLKERDLYMPDRQYARHGLGGKLKPEERAEKLKQREKPTPPDTKAPEVPPTLDFIYDAESDAFECPTGKTLTFQRERELQGVNYRMYRTYGCTGCRWRNICVGPEEKRKDLWIRADRKGENRRKSMKHYRSRGGQKKKKKTSSYPLTKAMREKLDSPEGRAVYSRRFPISEGVFGTMKGTRGGNRFLRRTLERVRIDWTERCIAHNLARYIGFVRLNPDMS